MHWTIAKKEFLSNLLNFRFVAGFILCFLLATLSAWIVTADYAERIADYSDAVKKHKEQLENAKVYSEVQVTLDKRPESLSLFCEGVEKQLSNTITVSHGEAPTISASTGSGNPLLAGFPSLDLSLIVQVVFSLLALLFVYDSISGEKEHGTLSLVLANAVPRHQVLLGKYLGIFLSLFVPILASMLAVIAIIMLSPAVALSSSDWVRLALISFVSLLYISAFCNIGFFVSSMTSRSTTSAMFLLFFWVTFILLIPKGSAYIASYLRPVNSLDVTSERTGALWDEFNANVQKFNEAHPAMGSSSWDYGGSKVFLGDRRKMMAYLEQAKFREPLRIEFADKVWEVMRQYYMELQKQASLATTLARISPVAAYQNTASALARTNTQSYLSFIQRAKDYRSELIDYLKSKKAFSSFLFLTRQKEEEMFDGEEFWKWARKYWDEWGRQFKAGKKFSEVDPWKSVEPLELSDMPVFRFNEAGVAESISNAFFDIVILVLLNVLFFLMAHLSFLRADVKS
jgi:ABC-type transport system involved in multi-copper enzyme maturation permease subunit